MVASTDDELSVVAVVFGVAVVSGVEGGARDNDDRVSEGASFSTSAGGGSSGELATAAMADLRS